MIVDRIYNHAHMLYQTADDDRDFPNPSLLIHMDNGDTVCIEQEDRELCLNKATIPELIKVLNKMKALTAKEKK